MDTKNLTDAEIEAAVGNLHAAFDKARNEVLGDPASLRNLNATEAIQCTVVRFLLVEGRAGASRADIGLALSMAMGKGLAQALVGVRQEDRDVAVDDCLLILGTTLRTAMEMSEEMLADAANGKLDDGVSTRFREAVFDVDDNGRLKVAFSKAKGN
jgi:hypothetical protein